MKKPKTETETAAHLSRLGRLVLMVWAGGILFVTSLLMANHIVAMPSPTDIEKLRQAVSELRTASGTPLSVHVRVYKNCSCTRSLFEHLVERGAVPDAEEIVLFVGEDEVWQRRANTEGVRFFVYEADGVRRRNVLFRGGARLWRDV